MAAVERVNHYQKERFLILFDTIEMDKSSKGLFSSRFHSLKEGLCDAETWSVIGSSPSISGALTDLFDALSMCRVFAYKRDATLKKSILRLSPLSEMWFKVKMDIRLRQIENKLKLPVDRETQPVKNASEMIGSQEIVRDADVPENQILKDGSEMVGFREIASKIEKFCINKTREDGFAAIAIIGTGGSGKTALAQKVCHAIRDAFDIFIWVCLSNQNTSGVSTHQSKKIVVKHMLERAGFHYDESKTKFDIVDLLERLRKRLKGKRYLIVFDDVCEMDNWYKDLSYETDYMGKKTVHQKLSQALPKGSGGLVIVTSRLEEAAKLMVGSDNIFRHDSLPKHDCWPIFELALKENGISHHDFQMAQKLENDIIENCDGLPLAAKAFAEVYHLLIRERKVQIALERNYTVVMI